MYRSLVCFFSLSFLTAGFLAEGFLAAAEPSVQQQGADQDQASSQDDPILELLQDAFEEQGIRFDVKDKICAVPASICIREDLLEYLVVGPAGAAHEALLSTQVRPSLLNTALVAMGVELGENAQWIESSPQPTAEELAAGAKTHEVIPPRGDGFFLYVAWREGEEQFLYRIEDLVGNLQTGRSLRRHRFVYLGSRVVRPEPDGEEVFAADWEGNLIALSYFQQGNTLLTAAVPECLSQTIFTPNTWLLPETRSEVMLVFSHARLTELPSRFRDALPVNGDSVAVEEDSNRDG